MYGRDEFMRSRSDTVPLVGTQGWSPSTPPPMRNTVSGKIQELRDRINAWYRRDLDPIAMRLWHQYEENKSIVVRALMAATVVVLIMTFATAMTGDHALLETTASQAHLRTSQVAKQPTVVTSSFAKANDVKKQSSFAAVSEKHEQHSKNASTKFGSIGDGEQENVQDKNGSALKLQKDTDAVGQRQPKNNDVLGGSEGEQTGLDDSIELEGSLDVAAGREPGEEHVQDVSPVNHDHNVRAQGEGGTSEEGEPAKDPFTGGHPTEEGQPTEEAQPMEEAKSTEDEGVPGEDDKPVEEGLRTPPYQSAQDVGQPLEEGKPSDDGQSAEDGHQTVDEGQTTEESQNGEEGLHEDESPPTDARPEVEGRTGEEGGRPTESGQPMNEDQDDEEEQSSGEVGQQVDNGLPLEDAEEGQLTEDSQQRDDADEGQLKAEEGQRFEIPHNLIFTYSTNILETKEPSELYENVVRTINDYRNAWDDPWAPVFFLDDAACLEKIEQVLPDLGQHFRAEPFGAYRADMCRLAALYLYGGYYFDIDIQVVKPYIPNERTAFASVLATNREYFFQAFIASVPEHPILKLALEDTFYVYHNALDNSMVGPITLRQAYDKLTDDDRAATHILEELGLDIVHYPDLPRQNGFGVCDYVVHDPEAAIVYFFSRTVGSRSCRRARIPEELWFHEKDNILETKTPKGHYHNVLDTIETYRDGWKEPDATVHFLDDASCRTMIRGAQPSLLPYFNTEESKQNRRDICILSALYQFGGYYFDTEILAAKPFRPRDITEFVATRSCENGCFSLNFFATIPRNLMIERALTSMLEIYRSKGDTVNVGPVTVANAFNTLSIEGQGKAEFLDEQDLDFGLTREWYPNVVRQHGLRECNLVLHDANSQVIHFFSNFRGYGGCEPIV